jgi:hypothetical protein
MCEPYRQMTDLANDNPKGLEPLDSPHNWSSNPGPIAGRLPMRGPSHSSSVIHAPTFSAMGSGNTVGRSANRGFGSVSNPAPGSVDPTADAGPVSATSGYSG